MKLTYRDKLILLGIIVIAIVLLAIFVIIVPKSKSIKANEPVLADLQVQIDEIENKKLEIPNLETEIQNAVKEGQDYANGFFKTDENATIDSLDTYKIDQYLQEYLNNNNISAAVGLNSAESTKLEYYYYTPSIVTYPIFEAADLNGSLASELSELMQDETILAANETQEVAAVTATLDVYATKEDIFNFINDIKGIDETVIITRLAFDDYSFGMDDEEEANDGYSDCTIEIVFYSMQEIQAPTF